MNTVHESRAVSLGQKHPTVGTQGLILGQHSANHKKPEITASVLFQEPSIVLYR